MKRINDVSIEEARQIRAEIAAVVEDVGKEEDKDYVINKLTETIGCYCLWLMKTDPSIKNVMGLFEKIESKKSNQYAVMLFDDFVGLFLTYNSSAASDTDYQDRYIENSESWNRYKCLADKYSQEELAAAVFKAEFIEDDWYDSFYATVPYGIGELIDRILDIKENDSVVEIGGSSYVLEALERNPKIRIEAFDEDNYSILTLVSILTEVMGYSDVVCRGSFEEKDQYDKVFVNNSLEPLNRSVLSNVQYDLENEWDEFPRDISHDWNMCGEGILRTKKGGKAVAIMNAGLLTLNKYRRVRELLCEGGYVEGVILLPDKMYTNTWINPYMLVMGRNNKTIKFLDARNEYIAGRVKGKRINLLNDEIIAEIVKKYDSGESCVEVPVEEIEKSDYVLTPNRYATVKEVDANLVRLGSMVKEIKRGITISASDMDQSIMDSPSDIKCLLPADITTGVITTERYYHGELRKPGKNEAHWGNILISKTGNPFRIAVADEKYLVVGNTYILDVDRSKYSPEYIKCYLSSEAGQREIMKYASGSATPIISVSNLSNIEIPIHDETTQKEMNKHAAEIVSVLKESYKQIQTCENEINALFR